MGGGRRGKETGSRNTLSFWQKHFSLCDFFFGGGVQKYTVVPIRKIMRTDHFCLSL